MAPGGAAAWIGELPDAPLPDGFEWLVLPDGEELGRLPDGRYRLVVLVEARHVEPRILERGGFLAMPWDVTVGPGRALQLLEVDDTVEPPLLIARREE
jgi:hypothetical protein